MRVQCSHRLEKEPEVQREAGNCSAHQQARAGLRNRNWVFEHYTLPTTQHWLFRGVASNFLNHKYILHCNLPMHTRTHTHTLTQDLCETVLWNSTFIHSVISYSIFWTTIITTRKKTPPRSGAKILYPLGGIIASWRLLHLWGVTRIRTHERHLDAYWTG